MKLRSISLAAALALTAAGASFAQTGAAPGAPAPGGPHAGHMRGMHMDPAQMAERHAQHLRDALQLRPDQEPALRAFIAATAPKPGEWEKMRKDHDAAQHLTTPERLDRMQAKMAEHEARFRAHAEALKRFYAQLSPAQQKAFDAMPMHGPGMGMGHGMHGMHGGPGGHDGMRHGPHGGPGHAPPPPGAD